MLGNPATVKLLSVIQFGSEGCERGKSESSNGFDKTGLVRRL
jgi:hypothetical protein